MLTTTGKLHLAYNTIAKLKAAQYDNLQKLLTAMNQGEVAKDHPLVLEGHKLANQIKAWEGYQHCISRKMYREGK